MRECDCGVELSRVGTVIRWLLLWSVIDVVTVSLIARWINPALVYPASWIVYAFAGGDAARRGKAWHGVVAGGAVAVVENIVWFAQGAPGHADTSDLPTVVAALTYVTLVVATVAIGAVCGAVGGGFARWARSRSKRRAGALDAVSFNRELKG